MTSQYFGDAPCGSPVEIYTLRDGVFEAQITTYGGVLVSLKVPDRTGHSADVVLGFDNLEGYVSNLHGPTNAYFGAIIGRYANRIAGGTFSLGGRKYLLPRNDGDNTLHGGEHGFHRVIWKATIIENGVELSYLSKNGEEGFPGNLSVKVNYVLANDSLCIEYRATTDRPTIVNLTNHTYFNLAGTGTILDHQLRLNALHFTPVDMRLIPTGELKAVDSTAFDFRKSKTIGERIEADDPQLKFGHGYDHNWVLAKDGPMLVEAAEVFDPKSGRSLTVLTDQPGIQFYSGNFLDGSVRGKGQEYYNKYAGLSLETQHFPDSPNHPAFPKVELNPGQLYHTRTIFRFSAR